MHVVFVSACEKKALKKTRAVLDSYAIRVGSRTWQAPMTMEGLSEVRKALKQKGITRQTAVAAYINYGMRRMKLAWVVGARHRFNTSGAYPVASTRRPYQKRQIEPWIRISSLLAGAAGDMHDIGKASVHFQEKLSPKQAGKMIVDDIRHEWLSLKLLQELRQNGWDWQGAWQSVKKSYSIDVLMLGNRKNPKTGVETLNEAVDYLVVTHHGLLGVAEGSEKYNSAPRSTKHVRTKTPSDNQLTCAGDLSPKIFSSYQKRIQRLKSLLSPSEESDTQSAISEAEDGSFNKSLVYWKALSLHARAALIHADHTVSAQAYSASITEHPLYANTHWKDNQKVYNQPLEWHLQSVGDRASFIATQMMTNLNLAGLCEQSVEFITQRTQNRHFNWQNIAANALQTFAQKHEDTPVLLFNIAGTGSGKTRMNLRAACILRPHDPRLSIALNLRSLTLQTGNALRQSMNLSEDELAVIIGDNTIKDMFEKSTENNKTTDILIDEDENLAEPIFDAVGIDYNLPKWLSHLYPENTTCSKYQKKLNNDRTILTAPLLVSTIDYLIAAGEPYRQGHHVKALLRLISSDLILDEIDGYEPKALMAVLRLVQLAGMYGRHVICSSATLSKTLATSVYRAFESGIAMRSALLSQSPPQPKLPHKSNNKNHHHNQFGIGIIDNEVSPQIWKQTLSDEHSTASDFQQKYQTHLDNLQQSLSQKPIYRKAELMRIDKPTLDNWKQAALTAAKKLHQNHAWQWKKTDKKVSFGLIRVANIYQAIDLAQYIADKWQDASIACYHANDWRISRFYKEMRLDTLLSRHIDGKKRKTGNEHIEQDTEIQQLVEKSSGNDKPFIVIATPVEEVGRDHDFDWAVIDASSVQSIVQTAGRVNRHRRMMIKSANIILLQYNHRHCDNAQQGKSKKPAFIYPGYENYTSPDKENSYPTHDIGDLLPWQDGQLVIDARLRFDTSRCLFASYDDQQIQKFCEKYFYDVGDELFSSDKVEACLMTEKIYKDTALRDAQYQEIYVFETTDENDTQLNFKKEEYMLLVPQHSYGMGWKKCNHKFDVKDAKANAWLALEPNEMTELCHQYKIDTIKGCQIALSNYHNQDIQWQYDKGFGVRKKRTIM